MAGERNGFRLFGWQIVRGEPQSLPSFAPEVKDDGAVVVEATPAVGAFNQTYIDLDNSARNDAELISRYNDMALQPEVDVAITQICNELIVTDEQQAIVELNLENSDNIPEPIKEVLVEVFKKIQNLLEFNQKGWDIARKWYIDGRLYLHAIIDQANPKAGIQELRILDPRCIRKVREFIRQRDPATGAIITQTINEYYIYNEKGFGNQAVGTGSMGFGNQVTGLRITTDCIIHVTSGLQLGNQVLSYLHKAIKPTNQLRAIEDAAVIYLLVRAPQRRVFYIDTGNLPKIQAEQHVRNMMTSAKNKLVYDSTTGAIRDDRLQMCYALDTKIPLLDGRTLELQQLIEEYNDGKQNWVYSCDPDTGKFVPGPVDWAGITKKNASVVRVTFDNGKSVVCTPDHKFPVWGKGFIEAKDLVGQSVIPGYRRNQKLYPTSGDYEQIYKNDTKTWEYTHRAVAKWKDASGIREEMLHLEKYTNGPKNTIHHKDFNRFNSSPDNLVRMHRDDHLHYHRHCAKIGFGRRLPNRSKDFTPEWRKKLSDKAKLRTPICKTWKITSPDGDVTVVENLSAFCRENNLNRNNIKGRFGSRKYFAEQLRNHKAISVEWLEDTIDVGCITIDKNETYHSHHTYLLDAGVYTKNTMLDDYWLARREGNKSTEIETLESSGTLISTDIIDYFLKRLYTSLSVPLSRLMPETMYSLGRASELSRDEANFALFIGRLRTRFSMLWLAILERELILQQVIKPEEWVELRHDITFKYARDNAFAELKELEIMTDRLNVLNGLMPFVGRYYSNEYVRRNILHQSDEDMEKMDKEIEAEMMMMQYRQPLPGEDPMMGGDGSPMAQGPGAPIAPPLDPDKE